MPSVILTGSFAVKGIIIIPYKAVSAFWVFPYPILKRLFDNFLLCLRRHRFLLVQHRFFIAILVINIIEYTGIFEIQRILDNPIGTRPFCTISAFRLDISKIGTLILDKPVAVIYGIAHADTPCGIARRC